MKSMNWISGTGRSPYSAMPIAVPMIPPSARGVSNTRSGNPSRSPSVQRKTPPLRPTSSQRTMTLSSRRIFSRRASSIACAIDIERLLQIARVKQVIPEAVPSLRVLRIRLGHQAVDTRGLRVVPLRAEACGGEGAGIAVDLALPLQERSDDGQGLLRAALFEQLMRPLHAGSR